MVVAMDILARTLWGEARGEGEKGMEAVACVILNRVHKPRWWGRNIDQVCQKPWQFSCWNDNDPNRDKLLEVTKDDPQFKTALEIQEKAVTGGLPDFTNGATSYFDRRMKEPPKWALGRKPCFTLGHHIFYED